MYTNIITISPHNLDMFRGVPVPSKALKRVFITSIERQKGTIFIKFASIVYPTGLYKRLVCPIVICFIAFVILLFHFFRFNFQLCAFI